MGGDDRTAFRQLARRRLIGAVLWLALVALLVPLLLDSTPRTDKSNAPGAIMHAGGNQPVAVTLQPAAAMVVQSPGVTPALPVMPNHATATQAPVSKDVPAVVPVLPQQTTINPVKEAVESVRPVNEHVNDVHPSVPAAPASSGESKDKPVAVDTTHHVQPVANKQVGYVVQLGVFANANSAQRLCKRVEAQHLICHRERMPSGASRLRVGPYDTRKEAEQVMVTLKLSDLPAQVVSVTH